MTAKEWNDRYPSGQPVYLTEDDKSIAATQTKSPAWELGDGTAVIGVMGKSGGYLLNRIEAR